MRRRSPRAEVLAGSVLLALASVARADDVPAFQLVRADEDWSVLADGKARPGVPAWKYLALDDTGAAWLSLGGELRERVDTIDAPRYGFGGARDGYLLQRLLVHADLHLGPRVRVFAQLGREDSVGKQAPGPSDIDRGDVQNLFLDLQPDAERRWTLRLGRQELTFNPTQRFIAVREGPNLRQSFDGLRASWNGGATHVDLFATRPVDYAPGAWDDTSDTQQRFLGAYVTHALGAWRLDGYALQLRRDDAAWHGRHAAERRDSIGARFAGRSGAWDLDVEALRQSGRWGDARVHAWAASVLAGYTLHAAASPRLGLELDAGSGGDDAHSIGTFYPLFPKGAYFNEAGVYSWANAVVLRPSLTLAPLRGLSLQASVLWRFRQNRDDAVYVQPSTALAPTLRNRERDVGRTLQLDATWRATRNLTVALELAHNGAGPAIRHAGGRDTDFALVSAQIRY